MLFWNTIKISLKSLWAHKLRSFLAMLGIIIGVGSVIAMLGLGTGAERDIMERMESMGTDLLIVRPASRGFRGRALEEPRELTVADARAILDHTPGVRKVSPIVRGTHSVTYRNKNTNTTIMGTSPTYLSIRNFEVEHGRNFSDQDVTRWARVGVIGPDAAEELFDGQNPLGKTVRVDHLNIQIIGILRTKGDQGWFNPDDQIIIPYTTAMRQLMGQRNLREVNVQTYPDQVYEAEEQILALLNRRHNVRPGQESPFRIRNQAERIEAAQETGQTFSILLGGIASISLLVGGIGIMNIMLVTVTERTREIGVRKAIGARKQDILLQFLIEAVLMSALGGFLGLLLGFGAAQLVDTYSQFNTIITTTSITLSMGFAIGIGVFFGFYPALRAARLRPIEALRYE